MSTAKRAGMSKNTIEAAIARGQGMSATGATLEHMTIEVIMSPAIAAVIEFQTDSKAKTLLEVREVVKKYGGTISATNYLFERKGRLSFHNPHDTSIEAILDQAIEVGALDIDSRADGEVIAYTDPSDIGSVSETMINDLRLKLASSELIWEPKKDSMISLEAIDQHKMEEFIGG